MNEKAVEQYLREQVKTLGGKAYKFVSPGNAGVPDRLICLPGGKVIFVELKAPGKKSTTLQCKRQSELIKLGQIVFIANSKSEVDKIIERCKGLIKQ